MKLEACNSKFLGRHDADRNRRYGDVHRPGDRFGRALRKGSGIFPINLGRLVFAPVDDISVLFRD